jgi:hypothetical protein
MTLQFYCLQANRRAYRASAVPRRKGGLDREGGDHQGLDLLYDTYRGRDPGKAAGAVRDCFAEPQRAVLSSGHSRCADCKLHFRFRSSRANSSLQLLWKKVEETYSREQYTETERWCETCLHPLLEKAGDVNKSKIARHVCEPTCRVCC